MRLRKIYGVWHLVSDEPSPAQYSTSQVVETPLLVLTDADVKQIVLDAGGDDAMSTAIQALKDEIANLLDANVTLEEERTALYADKRTTQSQLAEQSDLLAQQTSLITTLTSEKAGLEARVTELMTPPVDSTPTDTVQSASAPVTEAAPVAEALEPEASASGKRSKK